MVILNLYIIFVSLIFFIDDEVEYHYVSTSIVIYIIYLLLKDYYSYSQSLLKMRI